MSEVHPRIPYTPRGGGGRGASRGGRSGSTGTRGGSARSVRNLNGDINTPYSNEDEGQLKTKYPKALLQLEEMFENQASEDLISILEECDGDPNIAADRLAEGRARQWVVQGGHKPRPSPKPKAYDRASTGAATDSGRGPRARGNSEAGRSRGRVTGPENRNNPSRARPGPPPPNGVARQPEDLGGWSAVGETVPTTEAESTGDAKKKPDSSVTSPPTTTKAAPWTSLFKPAPTPAPVPKRVPKPVSLPPAPTPAPETKAAPEPKVPESNVEAVPPQEPTTEPLAEPSAPQVEAPVITPVAEPDPEPEVKPEVPSVVPAVPPIPVTLVTPAVPVAPAVPATPAASESPVAPIAPEAPAAPAAPETPVAPETPEVIETIPSPQPQQPLTEDNLEKIEDVAPPAPTGTQASTIASPAPTPSAIGVSIAPPPTQPVATTPRTAYAVAIPKNTPRSKYRTLTQQEPVIMPSPITHNAVEHPTLQFGSMGLGDEDGDEAEPVETVSQPEQPSQIAQPISALPPTGPAQAPVSQPPVTDALPTPRQAPGLPVHPQVAPQQPSPQPPLAPQSMTQQHLNQHMQYNRYEIPNPQQQPQTKPFDTFGPPAQQQPAPQPQNQPQQSQVQPPHSQPQTYTGYAYSQLQPHQQPSHISVGLSTTPDHQYNNYYDRTQPPGFGNLYNSTYMQQGQSQQDAGANQQRASSGLGGAGEALGQVPTSAPVSGQVQQPTSRYGAQTGEQSSGHGTPSPAITAAQQTSQPHQPGLAQYPGGMPSYGYQQHPYYSQFMHQSYYNHPNPFGKHQGMYGYPQAYMSPQYSDHSSSPAGLGGFGTPSTQGRESVGLGDYGRMNATASQQQQQQQSLPQHSSAGAYGNSNAIPNFLGSRGLPEQQQLGSGVGQQQVTQQAQNDDSMKFGENKPPTGPSSTPSIQGQPGRPGSATSGANMGPQHGAQTPGSMYGGTHLNHNLHQAQQSQYGVGQGQTATSQYSMYGHPHYGQSTQRHNNAGGWGTGYSH